MQLYLLAQRQDEMPLELLKQELNKLIASIPGLLGVLIVDRDGVPLIDVHLDSVPDLAVQPSALSMIVLAADQAAKLDFGKCSTICSDYEKYQIVTFSKFPTSLVVILLANSNANMGMLLSLGADFDSLTNELGKIRI